MLKSSLNKKSLIKSCTYTAKTQLNFKPYFAGLLIIFTILISACAGGIVVDSSSTSTNSKVIPLILESSTESGGHVVSSSNSYQLSHGLTPGFSWSNTSSTTYSLTPQQLGE